MSESIFDSSAHNYDVDFTQTPIGIMQRNRVYKYLLPLLSSQTKLLEINCGTGHDAINLAPKVSSVLATDLSQSMIEVAKKKAIAAKVNNVNFNCSDINFLHKGLDGSFDLLLSNFGGLNCLPENELKAFSTNIAPYISNNGRLVLVIMPKKCWIENLWFLLKRDPRYKRRQTSSGLETTINTNTFLTYYYSPTEIEEIFIHDFKVEKIRPIGFFIPPSYLNSLFNKRKWLLQLLSLLENVVGGIPSLSNYSDHFLIVLKKI